MSGITLTINHRTVSGLPGDTILDVARANGIAIPTLCHLDGLSRFGGCRLCMVEIEGASRPVPACMTEVQEGQVILTDTPRLQGYRQTIIELLLAERNHVCAVCVANGACQLQQRAATVGVDHVSCDYLSPDLPVDASHERFVLDHNRCILCERCVRVCAEVEGAHTWHIAGRGINSRLVADLNVPWGRSTTCTSCGKCVEVCPTGALIRRGSTVSEMEKRPDFLLRLLEGREKQAFEPPRTEANRR